MDLYLNPKETELLTRILEQRLEELHREINHTDRRLFKSGLKADEALMNEILGKLKTTLAMGI